MLRVMLPKKSRLKAPMMDTGMTVPMMSGVFHSWRKTRSVRNASMAPCQSSLLTAPMALSMALACSLTTLRVRPGFSSRTWARVSRTSLVTLTVLAPDSLRTSRPIDSAPSRRVMPWRSLTESRTAATSRRRTTPPASVTRRPISPISSSDSNSPTTRRAYLKVPLRMVPPWRLRLKASTRAATASMVRP